MRKERWPKRFAHGRSVNRGLQRCRLVLCCGDAPRWSAMGCNTLPLSNILFRRQISDGTSTTTGLYKSQYFGRNCLSRVSHHCSVHLRRIQKYGTWPGVPAYNGLVWISHLDLYQRGYMAYICSAASLNEICVVMQKALPGNFTTFTLGQHKSW